MEKAFQKIKAQLSSLCIDLPLGMLFLFAAYLSNLVLLPIARIPASQMKTYKLKVQIRAIHIACPYRDIAEEILGNRLVFFSSRDSGTPRFLYIGKRSLQDLPMEITRFKGFEDVKTKEQTLILEVVARKSLLCGYLPARILNYEITNEKPEFCK